jgi:hypothetical protein
MGGAVPFWEMEGKAGVSLKEDRPDTRRGYIRRGGWWLALL